MFDSLLIANRGEIVARIARTARRMGLRTIAVASDADLDSVHARSCDACVAIGGQQPADSYLRIDKLIEAARHSGARAVHPGYGFLAENAGFAQAVIDAGLVWIGPPPAAMTALGDKAQARQRAAALGVPVVPGYDGDDQDDASLVSEAARIGFPLLVKASRGGGGRGMRLVASGDELQVALQAARREAQAAFGDTRLVLERAVQRPRHVEMQVFGDVHGDVIHLGERDCSVQRRHQKLVEEAPCPALTPALRRRMGECAVSLARAIGYVGAGTVEMLLQGDGEFHFMEMNTRLQVEHPVTEALLGVDLVEWQLRIAAREPLPMTQDEALARYEGGGHAIEARLCAEDALRSDLPQSGRLAAWRAPQGVRCDHALASGQVISPHYDSMLAKLISHAATRDAARAQLARALDETVALGVTTNRALLASTLRHTAFAQGDVATDFLDLHCADRRAALPAASGAELAVGAVWLASHGAADLPAAWAASALAAPHETLLPIAIGGETQAWHLLRLRDGWRVHGPAGAYELSRLAWSRNDATLTLAAQVHGAGVDRALRLEGTLRRAADGDALHALCEGIELQLRDLRLVPPDRSRSAASGDVMPMMHGRLVQLHVAVGDTVAAGQTIAVLEAMKMEHALAAPVSGRVRTLSAMQGAQVSPTQVLIEIEPAA
jgi:geranyl-CoA carboxylase alpha subunit